MTRAAPRRARWFVPARLLAALRGSLTARLLAALRGSLTARLLAALVGSLTARLFVALLAVAAATAFIALTLAYVGARDAFHDHVAAVERSRLTPIAQAAEQLYARDGDWRAVAAATAQGLPLAALIGPRRPPPSSSPSPASEGATAPPLQGPPPFERLGLFDAQGRWLAGRADAAQGPARPLRVGGEEVGSLRLAPNPGPGPELDRRFDADQSLRFALAGAAALLIAVAGAWGLARHLRRPIRALAAGAQALAAGAYDARLSEARGDELGDLARAFNLLAEGLARQEAARRRWVSDTSHELRTPIALLRAQIEAIQDGVRPPDAANLAILQRETARLSKLADDLAALARADHGPAAYSFLPLDPVALTEELAERFRPDFAAKNLSLLIGPRPGMATPTLGDPPRLSETIAGLMENALRYTHAGGGLTVTFAVDNGRVLLRFDDTPPGVAEADLPRLFERFFRVEESRSRVHGGAGLGLALCRGVVEAHGGSLTAAPSPLGGLRVDLILPIETGSRR